MIKNIVPILIFLIYTIQGFSQGDSLRNNDLPTKNRLSFYTNLGFTVIPNTLNFNDFLISNGFPKINRVFEEWNYFGIEGQYNRFITKINFSFAFNSNSQTTNTNDFKTNMTINGIRGTFGFEVLSKPTWSIFPLIGFEVSGLSLDLTKSINDSTTLQDLIANPNIIKINQNNFLLMGEIGFRRMPNRRSSYGIYLGYKHDFTSGNWHYKNIEFNNIPKFKLTGFYFNFSLQINLFSQYWTETRRKILNGNYDKISRLTYGL